MKPTTHHLGHEPGRARLGACGYLRSNPTPAMPTGNRTWTGSWQGTALAPAATAFAAMGVVGTGAGFGSIEPTTRHLGTRST